MIPAEDLPPPVPPAPETLGGWTVEQWAQAWNELVSEGLYCGRVSLPIRSEAVRSAWTKALKSKELRELLKDPAAVIRNLREATFCHGASWLRFASLLCGRNRSREFYLALLMDGAYRDAKQKPKLDNATVGAANGHKSAGWSSSGRRRHAGPSF